MQHTAVALIGAGGPLTRILWALLLFAVLLLCAAVVHRVIMRLARRAGASSDAVRLLAEIARAAIIIVGIVTALDNLGVRVGAIIAGLGLTGFAVGFALRDVLSNALAGTLILIFRPFRRGDRIVVSGMEGEVLEIDLRYTVLKGQQRRILVPNSTLFTTPVSVLESRSQQPTPAPSPAATPAPPPVAPDDPSPRAHQDPPAGGTDT